MWIWLLWLGALLMRTPLPLQRLEVLLRRSLKVLLESLRTPTHLAAEVVAGEAEPEQEADEEEEDEEEEGDCNLDAAEGDV